MNIAGEEIHNSGKWFYFKFTIFLKWALNTPLQSYEISPECSLFLYPTPIFHVLSHPLLLWSSADFPHASQRKPKPSDGISFFLTSTSGIHLCFCPYSLLFLPTCLLILLLFKGIDQPCFFYITNVFLSNGCFPLEL